MHWRKKNRLKIVCQKKWKFSISLLPTNFVKVDDCCCCAVFVFVFLRSSLVYLNHKICRNKKSDHIKTGFHAYGNNRHGISTIHSKKSNELLTLIIRYTNFVETFLVISLEIYSHSSHLLDGFCLHWAFFYS